MNTEILNYRTDPFLSMNTEILNYRTDPFLSIGLTPFCLLPACEAIADRH
jgi:hypothetical protein